MTYTIEPKVGYTVKSIASVLEEMDITYLIKDDVLFADLTFSQVADLKDKAYCTHMEHDDS